MTMNKNNMMQTEMPLNASRGICFRAGRGIQRHTPFRGCLYLPPHVPLGLRPTQSGWIFFRPHARIFENEFA